MGINRIIIDTSAYSGFLRGNPDLKLFIQQADEIAINPIVLGELIAGFAGGRHEKRNRSLLQEFLASSRVTVIDMNEETSERYAVIINHLRNQGTPIPTNNIWIAALAMQYGLKILTTDKHYMKMPQVLVAIPS